MTSTEPGSIAWNVAADIQSPASHPNILPHLYELVRRRAQVYPSAIALGGQQGLRWKTLTSRELLELVDSLAADLAARHGVRDGDQVVL